MSVTQYGETVDFGCEVISTNIICNSAQGQRIKAVKDVKNEIGNDVGRAEHNEYASFQISGSRKTGVAYSAIEADVTAWVVTKATAAPFNLPAGGVACITDFSTTKSNEDYETCSITVEYKPYMPAGA